MTIIVAIFCMAQLYAASPVKQWGATASKGSATMRPEWKPCSIERCESGMAQHLASILQQASRKMARHRLACQHHPCSDGHPDRRQLSGKS